MRATSCCHRCFKDLGSVQSEAVDRTFATGIHLPSQVLQEIVRAGKGPLHHAFISGFPVPWGLEKPRAGLTVKPGKPPQTRCVHCLKHYLARKQALAGKLARDVLRQTDKHTAICQRSDMETRENLKIYIQHPALRTANSRTHLHPRIRDLLPLRNMCVTRRTGMLTLSCRNPFVPDHSGAGVRICCFSKYWTLVVSN